MARLSVYVPDDLAERARAAGLNVSRITQQGIEGALSRDSLAAWLDGLDALPGGEGPTSETILAAVREGRDDLGA